jgi:DNA repair photolyase
LPLVYTTLEGDILTSKVGLVTDDKKEVEAQNPVIISASRSTDIPAFYANWFKNRWEKGYVKWINPFNNKTLYVSLNNAEVVVFWSKNPQPMLEKSYLHFLNTKIKSYYFQYTLNNYEPENFEESIPPLESRIKTFKDLSNTIGKEKVIWRYDPLILTKTIDVDQLLTRVKNIGDELCKFTDKLVFSFADIGVYKKVKNNLKNIQHVEFSEETMEEFAYGIQQLNNKWGLELATCSELINLEKYGIIHNKCIDDELLIKLFPNNTKLMKFLGVEVQPPTLFSSDIKIKTKKFKLKDVGQRKECGCIKSKDIGQYNTCPHGCIYCYANTSKKNALKNYKLSITNQHREAILPEKS